MISFHPKVFGIYLRLMNMESVWLNSYVEAFDTGHPKRTPSICTKSKHYSLLSVISNLCAKGGSPNGLGFHESKHGIIFSKRVRPSIDNTACYTALRVSA